MHGNVFMSESRFLNFYCSKIYGYFQAQIKNLRLFKFFQKINFYVWGTKRTFTQHVHHSKNTNNKKPNTPYFTTLKRIKNKSPKNNP